MKKIMLSLAMALVSVCASAQVYIGGTAGISSNKIGDGDSKTAYTLMPEIGYEFNNKWEAGLEIGIKKGDVCELREVREATTFIVAPYVRYTAVEPSWLTSSLRVQSVTAASARAVAILTR